MTNAHVVAEALREGWPVLSALTLTCDFARESVLGGGALLPVDNDYQIHAGHDLALLYLRQAHFTDTAPPPSLSLAVQVPQNAVNLSIGVIGHPALNTQRDGVFPIHYGFGNAFGIKRFSPGLVRARAMRDWYGRLNVDAIFHDATTLGGSSGSCILDLNRGLVVGLHFGGWPMPVQPTVQIRDQTYLANLFHENGAVPLWTLAEDTLPDNVNFIA